MSAACVNELPDEFFEVPALLVLHGQAHACFDCVVQHMRVLCNPRGYVRAAGAEFPDFAPERLTEV
ncbi:hypothetical protein [Variovorax rhizosphaerae]|uniref:Uncharacterized protein n=1 Tax=Variovorax rhizosphaerae TaxID=1836200 RepID=A0ABU8WPQ4_9BURK